MSTVVATGTHFIPDASVFHDVKTEHEWYVDQHGRAVVILERKTARFITVFTPPFQWGDDWAWNLSKSGIVFVRK